MPDIKYPPAKTLMLSQHLMQRGITDPRILKAMADIPREEFVPEHLKEFAYQDNPLPIGYDQTISQPYVVALMCQLLELTGKEKVLDIGGGSGYQAAVLSCLVKKVISVERIPQLAAQAEATLRNLGIKNVIVIVGDGYQGYQPQSPYDAIKSAAAADTIPQAWKDQLKTGGRIIAPLNRDGHQELVRVVNRDGQFDQESWGGVTFVPLVTQK